MQVSCFGFTSVFIIFHFHFATSGLTCSEMSEMCAYGLRCAGVAHILTARRPSLILVCVCVCVLGKRVTEDFCV